MKVILLDDVEKLGKLGDVVEVKKGYARNYLFARNLAVEALDKNLKVLEERKRKREQRLTKIKKEMEGLSQRMSGMSFTIPMTAGEEDKLYGSVTADIIREAFAAEGINIDTKDINIEEPIKKLGVYQIKVKLHPEVTAMSKIWVVRK